MQHVSIKVPKNHWTFDICFVELCGHIIQKVSKNVQTQRNL